MLLTNWTVCATAATVDETFDWPLVHVSMLDEWDDEAQVEYLELHGENPSMMTLQRFGISRVYTADGEKIKVDTTKTLTVPLYADANQQTQYVYYGGYIYLLSNEKVQGKLSKPTQTDGIEVQTYTDSGHGYVVENQNYSFERLNKNQSCALVHFVEESDDPILEDYMVFFDQDDLIRITYPEVEGLKPLSPGCWSWDAFELTAKYYESEDICKSVSSATFVGSDNIIK